VQLGPDIDAYGTRKPGSNFPPMHAFRGPAVCTCHIGLTTVVTDHPISEDCCPNNGRWVFQITYYSESVDLQEYSTAGAAARLLETATEAHDSQRERNIELFDDDCPVRVGQATLRVRKKGRKRKRDKQRVVKKKRKTEKKKRKEKKLLEKLRLERSRKRVMRPPLQSEV
jgi:hypothetical protein